MTDQTLRRTDELLSELVELVETARTLPMSSSCILPRERVLDVLDELRETMPPEVLEARRVIAARDVLLHDAHEQAVQARESATADAEAIVAEAGRRAEKLTADAETQAYEIVESARAEHDHLVSATGVHQAAAAAASALREAAEQYDQATRADADAYAATVRAEADDYGRATRAEAERYAAKLSTDAEQYADHTLAELAGTLSRAAATAEQGRTALAQRRSQAISD